MRLASSMACMAIAACLPSCLYGGAIYQRTTTPLDVNLRNTPAQKGDEAGDTKHFRFYVEVNWDSNSIGDIAKKAGMERVYYADLTRFNVLGVWRQNYVTIYGK